MVEREKPELLQRKKLAERILKRIKILLKYLLMDDGISSFDVIYSFRPGTAAGSDLLMKLYSSVSWGKV